VIKAQRGRCWRFLLGNVLVCAVRLLISSENATLDAVFLRCLIGDWFEHSMDVADEHSRVTDDVLLHEVDGVVNLARSAQHLNDGVMLVLVPE